MPTSAFEKKVLVWEQQPTWRNETERTMRNCLPDATLYVPETVQQVLEVYQQKASILYAIILGHQTEGMDATQVLSHCRAVGGRSAVFTDTPKGRLRHDLQDFPAVHTFLRSEKCKLERFLRGLGNPSLVEK